MPLPNSGKPLVFVCIPPQADFVRRLAGDRFDVAVLLPRGASHETYEPKPSQIRELSRAVLYVRVGLPFEAASWDKIRGANPKMGVAYGFEGIKARALEEDGHHSHGEADPHLWLYPAYMRLQAQAVAAALKEMDPLHAAEYEQRLASTVQELDALDAELRRTLEPVRGKTFWVYHPAWGYFADAYGLKQHAVETEGKEPGAQSLSKLIDTAKREGVRVIFVDPQSGNRNARVVAQEIGAQVRELNPLADDYAANLRAVARAIAEAVK